MTDPKRPTQPGLSTVQSIVSRFSPGVHGQEPHVIHDSLRTLALAVLALQKENVELKKVVEELQKR